jgi:hypothetical protein
VPCTDDLVTPAMELRAKYGPYLHKSLFTFVDVCKAMEDETMQYYAPFAQSRLTHILQVGGGMMMMMMMMMIIMMSSMHMLQVGRSMRAKGSGGDIMIKCDQKKGMKKRIVLMTMMTVLILMMTLRWRGRTSSVATSWCSVSHAWRPMSLR